MAVSWIWHHIRRPLPHSLSGGWLRGQIHFPPSTKAELSWRPPSNFGLLSALANYIQLQQLRLEDRGHI